MEQMQADGIQPDAYSHSYVLNGLAKARLWHRARAVFDGMIQGQVPINHFSYNAMVEAAGTGSPFPRRHMVQVLGSVLSMCCPGGDVPVLPCDLDLVGPLVNLVALTSWTCPLSFICTVRCELRSWLPRDRTPSLPRVEVVMIGQP